MIQSSPSRRLRGIRLSASVAKGPRVDRAGDISNRQKPSGEMTDPLNAEVLDRFGVIPNFFRLAADTPEITKNLWGFARFGYLDNPMPSLFKERLFVYLSRFCNCLLYTSDAADERSSVDLG